MKVRLDVAKMLWDGHTQNEIMSALHVGPRLVTDTRRALRIPGQRPGRKPRVTLEQALRERSTVRADGCWTWNGSTGYPMLTFLGARLTARRAAFLTRWDRNPTGHVTPSCGRPGCVAPDHMDDQPMRDRIRTQYAAVFGTSA